MNKKNIIILTIITLLVFVALTLSLLINPKNEKNKKQKEEIINKKDELDLKSATDMINSLYKNEHNKIEIKEYDTYFEATITSSDTGIVVDKFKLDKETGVISSVEMDKVKTASGSSE